MAAPDIPHLGPLPFTKGERQIDHKDILCWSIYFVAGSRICTMKLFFSTAAGGGLSAVASGLAVASRGGWSAKANDPGRPPVSEATAMRDSDSRFAGRSTSTPMRWLSGSPFVA